MDDARAAFEEHLNGPRGRGALADAPHSGAAGGAACGDLIRISVELEDGHVREAGFDASGCGAVQAAGSAVVSLVAGSSFLAAARVGPDDISEELGGLAPAKMHAASLAADALHRALGSAAKAGSDREIDIEGAMARERRSRRTLVAMSGGVDSAVASLLAAGDGDPGTDVATVTLELWADADNDGARSCCSAAAVRGARRLAHELGLPHFTLDLRDEFRAGVVAPWLAEHAEGLTPNPCVRCNGHVRLDAMLAFADRVGAATLTTGHYARRTAGGLLRLAVDPAKDQTYMLAALGRAALGRLRFPLGEHTKDEVRAIAERAGLAVARRPESQDLCFLAGTGRATFLARHGGLREREGDIVDRGGRVLGRHRGHHGYTVGQRKGLGIAAAEPLYVVATDARANTVTVGTRAELATSTVRVRGVRLHGAEPDAVQLRYHAPPLGCRLEGDEIHLEEPFDGAAPGQTAVFLRGDAIVGCATIA
jgi:tRNA-specific 2-thiouridylase